MLAHARDELVRELRRYSAALLHAGVVEGSLTLEGKIR